MGLEPNPCPAPALSLLLTLLVALEGMVLTLLIPLEGMRRRLLEAGAEPLDVAYRENRLVLFDSSLYHETQPFSFEQGRYTARRLNFTFLFGLRSAVGDLMSKFRFA